MATDQSQASAQDIDGDLSSPSNPAFQWPGTGKVPSLDDASSQSGDEDQAPGSPGARAPPPMQKRRRVTRACDECRRKKIKCDGKQPCTHCTVYSYDCTYDQPSNRRRNPAPQYIEAIENRLHRAEALLKTVMPEVDLNDPNMGVTTSPGPHFPQPGYEKNVGGSLGPKPGKPSQNQDADTEKDSMLESMVQNTGSLDLDDKGHWDFYGHSSSLVFLKRLRAQFGDMTGEAEGHGDIFARARVLPNVIESPRSADSPLTHYTPEPVDLPSKACAQSLCDVAIQDALSLMRFIHQPTFNTMLNRILDLPSEQWGNEDHRYLPLVYSLMAVGSLFARTENSKLQLEGYETAIESGFKYFKASRQLMDITDCRDLPSLQAIICMIYFLQSSANLSTCYSYIGIALRSAIRMGLHRSISGRFNPIETEIRKRVFWQIRKLDIYVGALLGLPMMISDDDVDQEQPLDVDDEFVTVEQILPMPEDRVPLMSAMNAHTKVVRILQKVNRYIYPLKGLHHDQNKAQTYSISHARIREVERDLQDWMESLPMGLRPGGTVSPELTRVQQLLRIAYAHTQLFLYRPFLHYTAGSQNRNQLDKRSYACVAACVSVSRNIIHIVGEMSKRGLLIGAYWFTMYTAFMAVLTLVFFVIENPNNPSSTDIIKDAREGKEILAGLAKRSMAADRCARTLTGLFEQFDKMSRLKPAPSSRKRAASPNPAAGPASIQSTPSLHAQKSSKPDPHSRQPQRAQTYPDKGALGQWKPTYPYAPSDSTYPNSPSTRDIYTPPSESMPGVLTPDSASTSTASVSGLPYSAPFLNPHHPNPMSLNPNPNPNPNLNPTTNPGLPDLSPLMFPSADPFAYPNQPMTALEQTKLEGLDGKEFGLPQGMYAASPTQGQAGLGEVQIFGPMPPYLMHGQSGLEMGLGLEGWMGGAGGGGQGGDGGQGQGQGGGQGRDGGWGAWMGGEFQG